MYDRFVRPFRKTETKLIGGMSKSTFTHLNTNYDCIIVGAGVTGLIAARDLAKKEVKVLLVEATDRLGGRIFDDSLTFQAKAKNPTERPLSSKGSFEENSTPSAFKSFNASFGAHKFFPSNNENLVHELKRYKLKVKEEKYTKTFVQVKLHHVISLYDLFQRVQRNPHYQAIVKDLNELSLLIDPLHAPFDYDQDGDYYNTFEYPANQKSSAFSSSDSISSQQKYYELFKKNILQSDLYHQYDIKLIDYLNNHKIFMNQHPKTEEDEEYSKDNELIIEFLLLNSILLFELDSSEISLLMLLNMINLFYFKFENILSFNFHSYSTIDHSDGFHALLENIFQEFIDAGGQYLFNTPLISVYQNIHYYQASLNNYYEGSNNTYNVQSASTPYYPKTRPTTSVATTGDNLPLPEIAPTDLQPVRVKTAYPITNTFLQLPADIINSICKLANGELYQCKQIILTVPINCLSSIQFFPNLSTIFQRAVERCYPNSSSNLLQLYAICSNHIREKEDLPENIINHSNISNRLNRIVAFPSGEAVRLQHNVYQSMVHHRQLYFNADEEDENESFEKKNKRDKDDFTLLSIHGLRHTIVERKQESFELMHPEIEKLSKHSLIYHDFVADPFIRTNWFHLRQGTRNLYLRLCIEAIAPWKYCKENNRGEDTEDFQDASFNFVKQPGTIPVVQNDHMSLYITNADLSPHWTGWIEGGIYMGKRAAEILYPRIVSQPVSTNFARKNDRIGLSR